MKSLEIQEHTFKRLSALLNDLMTKREKNLDYDDLINELVDIYQQNNWDHDLAGGG